MADTPGIVSALLNHANGVRDLSRQEKQALLREAGNLIRVYTQLASFSEAGSQTGGLDFAHELDQFAEHIDFKYADEAKIIMLKAADDIRVLRLMLGIKPEAIERV